MLLNIYKSEVKRSKLLCEQIIHSQLSLEKGCMFFKETLTKIKVPGFYGFKIRAQRESR